MISRRSRYIGRFLVQLHDQRQDTFEHADTIDEARTIAGQMSASTPQWEVAIHNITTDGARIEVWQGGRLIRSLVDPGRGVLHGVSVDQLAEEILSRGIDPHTPLHEVRHLLRDQANNPDLIEPGY